MLFPSEAYRAIFRRLSLALSCTSRMLRSDQWNGNTEVVCHQLRTTDEVEVATALILQRKYIHSVGIMWGSITVCRLSRPSFEVYSPLLYLVEAFTIIWPHLLRQSLVQIFKFFSVSCLEVRKLGEKITVNGPQSPVICNCVAMENRTKLIVITFRRTTSLTSAKSESSSKSWASAEKEVRSSRS